MSAHISLAADVAAPGFGMALCFVSSGHLPTQTRTHLVDRFAYLVEPSVHSFPVLTCIKRVQRRVHGDPSQLPVLRPFRKGLTSLYDCVGAARVRAALFPLSCGLLPWNCGSMLSTRIASTCFTRPGSSWDTRRRITGLRQTSSTDMIHLVVGSFLSSLRGSLFCKCRLRHAVVRCICLDTLWSCQHHLDV